MSQLKKQCNYLLLLWEFHQFLIFLKDMKELPFTLEYIFNQSLINRAY